MSTFGSYVRLGKSMDIFLVENRVADDEIKFSAKVKMTETISVQYAQTISP